jgi:autotransporter-associated beta strand protein
MLLVNGAIAVLNGMLVTTCKILCCLRGGVYCGGVCRCPEEGSGEVGGECCDDEWYTDPGECCDDEWIDENGTIEGREGEWVCCEDSNGNITFPLVSPADPGCGSNTGRCCTDGFCTEGPPEDCLGELLQGSCERFGCPKSCCTEDDDGLVACDVVDEGVCGGIVDEEPCESACKGACCFETDIGTCQYTAPGGGQFGGAGGGDTTQSFSSTEVECTSENLPEGAYDISWTQESRAFISAGDTTQSECDELDGYWQGLGETACSYINEGEEGHCRPPFSTDCCERVVSSAARLTFRGPRNRRYPGLTCGFLVTVTVTTGSPVYIHGGLFGSPYEACTVITSFYLCNDEFYVTPAPCSGNLQNLDIEVCWEEGTGEAELLRFHCCQNITYLLGNCDCGCTTRLLYEGEGCTSNAVIQMRGDAVIDASGTGPLVLTSNITHGVSCERTLTLAGMNTDQNSLASIPGQNLDVTKDGPGVWRLTAASSFDGQLKVLGGTIVAAVGAGQTGSGVFGSATTFSKLPLVGDSSAGASGEALLLLEGGVNVERGLTVDSPGGSQVVILGMTGSSGTATFGAGASIRLGRDVTLSASTGGEVIFTSSWEDLAGGSQPAVAFTIGRMGNLGTVVLQSFLPEAITLVTVFSGATAKLDGGTETIWKETPVVLEAGSTLDLNGTDQPLESLEMRGSATLTGGVLQTLDEVKAIGGGNLIASDVSIDATTTIDVSGALTISGDVSGTSDIVKTGSGTLTFTGSNTYTGTTTVQAGVLQIGNGGTAGTLGSGSVVNDAIVVFNRSDNLTVSNVISGSGSVVKLGGGELTLSGANTYSGGTTVSAGILIGTTASLQGDIVVAAATTLIFDDPSGGTYAGVISGNGAVEKRGAGSVIFTGANTYTGGTTVSAGSLVGTTNSLQGDVANFSTLVFDDASGGTYAGTISGTGTVEKTGAGTVVFTGSNSYTGATTISTGTLQVGNGGAAGTLGTGAVNNNGALAFNRNNAITVASAISGTGSLAQNGSGTLTLTGTLSYTGTTDIAAGTLVVTTLVSGPANVSSSTFTTTTLVVEFTATPSSGETYRLLPGATAQTYATVTLNGAGGATGTYNSANSTLTID